MTAYAQREHALHGLKSPKMGYFQPKSRKRKRMAKGAAVRYSKRAYRAQTISTTVLSNFGSSQRGYISAARRSSGTQR